MFWYQILSGYSFERDELAETFWQKSSGMNAVAKTERNFLADFFRKKLFGRNFLPETLWQKSFANWVQIKDYYISKQFWGFSFLFLSLFFSLFFLLFCYLKAFWLLLDILFWSRAICIQIKLICETCTFQVLNCDNSR